MKLLIVFAAVTLAQAAKLDRVYLPPNAQASAGSDNFLQTPHQSFNGARSQNINDYTSAISNGNGYAANSYSSFEGHPERAQAAFERNAAILRQDNSNDGETYSYAYETENGIYAEESGVATNGVKAQGGYSYTGDDGQVYSVRYTADENGFLPQGDHLPTSPPIPEEIQKALDQNARDEAAGIYDDGSYNDGKYSAVDNSQQQQYNPNAQPINYNEDSVITNAVFNVGARLNANAIEKTYLPPLAQRSNSQMNRNYNSNPVVSNAFTNNGGKLNANSIENTYLPPTAQRSNSQISRNSIIPNAVTINNGARLNTNSVENTYLPPFAQRTINQINRNYNSDPIVPNAFVNNGGRLNANSVDKTYLPHFSQRSNSQRNGIYTDNAAAVSKSARFNNSIEKTYLPPVAQRSNIQRNGNFNSRNGYRY